MNVSVRSELSFQIVVDSPNVLVFIQFLQTAKTKCNRGYIETFEQRAIQNSLSNYQDIYLHTHPTAIIAYTWHENEIAFMIYRLGVKYNQRRGLSWAKPQFWEGILDCSVGRLL